MLKKLLLIALLAILLPASVRAQEEYNILAIIKYQTIEELNTLFSQDTQVLYYTNDDENSLALTLLSTPNEQYLRKLGFIPEIIERGSNINNYVLLYTRVKSLENPLSQYGQVYTLTPNLILLKLTNKSYAKEILSTNVQLIPFLARISPPLYKAKTITAQPIQTAKPATKPTKSIQIFFWIILITLLSVAAVSFIKQKIGKSKSPPIQS